MTGTDYYYHCKPQRMDYVRFRADYGGKDYVATDIFKVELVDQMDRDPSFATFRIWYSDPENDPDDYETLSEAFIEEACTVPAYPDRDQFQVKLASSYAEEDVKDGEIFSGTEYCRRHYPQGGNSFQISLIGETTSTLFVEQGIGGDVRYSEIVELFVE